MTRYDECLAFILRPDIEGGRVDDPVDRGGSTNHGVTQHSYDSWLTTQGRASCDVSNITPADIAGIYGDYFWRPSIAVRCAAPLDLVMFDAAVQHGPARAIKFLQRAMNVNDDGVAGAKTMVTLANHAADSDLVTLCIAEREKFYAAIIANDPSQERFRHGWANRIFLLKEAIAAQRS